MKEIKILYLYPDMLELYGDYGNIQVLKFRIEQREFKCVVDRYSIGDEKPNFEDYDLIFAGGGAGRAGAGRHAVCRGHGLRPDDGLGCGAALPLLPAER